LRRVGILAVDQTETAIDCFHFVMERRFFLSSLRKSPERQKEAKREHDKSGALERCFHSSHPINARINALIRVLTQEQKILPSQFRQ
jgi:hypothetical protein